MRKPITIFFALALATAAFAATEAELLSTASSLDADLSQLETNVLACTDGTCSNAQDLLDEYDALSADLAQLHSDRSTLSGCTCTSLDAAIADLDALDNDIVSVLIGWEDDET